jgi:hypothetical protein
MIFLLGKHRAKIEHRRAYIVPQRFAICPLLSHLTRETVAVTSRAAG